MLGIHVGLYTKKLCVQYNFGTGHKKLARAFIFLFLKAHRMEPT